MTQEISAGHGVQLDFDSLPPAPGDDPVTPTRLEINGEDPAPLPPLPALETVVPLAPADESAPTLSATRASRLRRIVRDGEEIARRLDRLSEELHREIPEAYHTMERGSDRAADLLSELRDAFDRTAFFARGQAKQAADRLMQADQPVRFTRPRKTEATPEAGEGTQPPPLWKLFASGQGDAPNEDADHQRDSEEQEGESPPWTNL